MDRATYDRMAEIDGAHWWFVARRRIVAALIRAQAGLPPAPRILEVGCGTGSNLALLQGFGRVDAIEPDDGARALAEARSGLAIQGGLLPDGVVLEDGAYDLIVLLDVLEHIPGDVAALGALLPKLAPNGRLLLTVPAMPSLWSAHDVAHHHQRRYTAGSLAGAVGEAGFRIRHLTHFNTLLMPLVVAVRALGRLAGRGGGDDAMPGPLVNRLLERTFAAEARWVARRRLPAGISLALVAERG